MTIKTTQLRIRDEEHRARCDALLEHVEAASASGVVLFDADYIKYYTGFTFIPTERPMAFAMNAKGERGLFVPRLELEHAQANALVERVSHYLEYPDDPHPMFVLADMLKAMGIGGRTLADADGYPWILGYRGPALSEAAKVDIHQARAFIEDQMAVKSPAEIELIKESVRWGNLAHTLLQRYTRAGLTETEVTARASNEATRAMLDAIGPIYRAASSGLGIGGAFAGYRGQIGRNAAIPHALANNLTFQAGDTLVTGAAAAVWGYLSELERTMFIGPPSGEQRRFFDHMVALQDTALGALAPGKRCADVDLAVRAYFEKHDLMPYWKHHSGHCIGLRYHEGPFLDKGDTTVLKPGMVFTVEPGLYVPGVGGFRHSDTVVITGDGVEMLTYYPRAIESLTLPAD
ncbi:MAG: aminopeptidase P family protein [Anaerolineae bacterium]|nr:aminopeptidase P family protein [Anaerolineae bacterium]